MSYKIYWLSLTEEERKYQLALVERLQKMRDNREQRLKEFNNLQYSENYELKREADLGYNDLKDFYGDRVNEDSITKLLNLSSGGTRTKVTAILSHLLQFNFQPDIEAQDKEKQTIKSLGENLEDLVKRSREIETWDEKKIDVYREFVSQGNVFLWEVHSRVPKVIHDNGSWKVGDKIGAYEKDKNALIKYEMKCETRLFLGRDVYLSSMRERNIQKQTMVALWEELSFADAELRYGKWDRWDYVKETKGKEGNSVFANIVKQDKQGSFTSIEATVEDYFWQMRKPEDEVGILHIFDRVKKTYMVFVNGIMVLPIGYSLYELSPSGLLPLAKGDAEINIGFAYSKGVGDTTFADNKMADAVYNSMVRKMLQSAQPTMGNTSGMVVPKGMLYSSRLISGLREGQFQPLLPAEARQITNSDTAFLQVVKMVMADKTVDDTFAGQNVDTKTATEYLERKKNTIMKLYSLVLGLQNLEEQLVRLRIYSLLSKWTGYEEVPVYDDLIAVKDGVMQFVEKSKTPRMTKVYRDEMVSTTLKRDGGAKGYRHIRFHDNESELPDENTMMDEEKAMSKQMGGQVRVEYLNVSRLAEHFSWIFNVNIIPKKEDDSRLEVISFIDVLTRLSMLIAGDQAGVVNREGTIREVSEKMDLDPDKIFNMEAPQQPQQIDPATGAPVIANPLAKTTRPALAGIQ